LNELLGELDGRDLSDVHLGGHVQAEQPCSPGHDGQHRLDRVGVTRNGRGPHRPLHRVQAFTLDSTHLGYLVVLGAGQQPGNSSERKELIGFVGDIDVLIFHMEKVAALLDQPSMVGVRQQFLGIDPGSVPLNLQLKIDGPGYLGVDGDELREGLLEVEDENDRETAESRRAAPPSDTHRVGRLAGNPQPGTTTSPNPRGSRNGDHATPGPGREGVGRIEDYIIGLTCPALYFTITNVAESFLHDPRIRFAEPRKGLRPTITGPLLVTSKKSDTCLRTR
jgi:hypothetical protein